MPRLGSGGFKAALEGVWSAVTEGAKLETVMGGKPSQATFGFAEEKLVSWRQGMSGKDGKSGDERGLKRVYMVGGEGLCGVFDRF